MQQNGQIWITKSLNERQRVCVQNFGLSVKEIPLSTLKLNHFPERIPSASAWVFTSQNAVKNLPKISFSGPVYASGNQTAKALMEKGFEAKLGANETALSLAKKITEDGVKSVVFFCGNMRRNELPEYLAKKNIELTEIVVYQTILSPKSLQIHKGDALFFMSPSAVESFAMKNEFHSEINYYSIGETTAEALRNKGVKKINTAAEATFEAMLKKYTS